MSAISGRWKSFKTEECFLFHLKSSFRSWDISIFVLTLFMYKDGLIRKLRSTSNLWRHNLDNKQLQYTNTHIARYLKKSLQPDNEIGSVNIFLQKSCTKYGDKTSPRPSRQNQIWANNWIYSLKFHTVCFHCMFKSRATKTYWN